MEFIDGSLTIADMYILYTIYQEKNKKKCVLKHVYNDLFNKQQNIGFFKPKKDQCTVCEVWKNSNDEEKNLNRINYDVHI